jgi:hypothetical protein
MINDTMVGTGLDLSCNDAMVGAWPVFGLPCTDAMAGAVTWPCHRVIINAKRRLKKCDEIQKDV